MTRLQKRWRRRLPALLDLMDVHSRAAASGSHQVQQMGGHEAAALAGRVARSLARQPHRIPMRKLAKGYDDSKHPREHDGKFARKTGEIVGRVGVGVAGAVGGFLLGRKYGAQAGGFLARHGAKLITKNPVDRLLHETAGHQLGREHGAKIAAAAGAVAGGLAGGAAGAMADRFGRNRRADAAYDRAASEGRMTQEEAAEAKGVYRRSKGRGITRQRKKEGLPMRKLSPIEQLQKGLVSALQNAYRRGAMRAGRAAYREGHARVMAEADKHAKMIGARARMNHAANVAGKSGYEKRGPTQPLYDNRHLGGPALSLDRKRGELFARNEAARRKRYETAKGGVNADRVARAAEANAGPEIRQTAKNSGRMYARDAMDDWRKKTARRVAVAAAASVAAPVAAGGAAYGAHRLTEKQRQQRVEAAKASAEARRGRGGIEKMADPYAGLPLAKAEQLRREDDAFAAQLRAALTMPVSAAFR